MKGNDAGPLKKKVAFAIRDDDVSYFTQPWMLDLLYSQAWRLGFKVSLAIIPNVKATQYHFVPFPHRGTNKFFPISENTELVDYLQKKIASGYVDIVQHGYTHSRENGKPEFAVKDLDLVDDKLKKGKKLLEETFEQDITVFTAPHEGISRATWRSLSKNRMFICRRFTLGRLLMTAPILNINFYKLAQTILHCPNPFKLMPSTVIDLADVLAVQWSLLFSSNEDPKVQLEKAKERFQRSLSEGKAFIVLHHHWEYFYDWESKRIRQDLLACFNSFLNFVSSSNSVWKTTLGELCSLFRT